METTNKRRAVEMGYAQASERLHFEKAFMTATDILAWQMAGIITTDEARRAIGLDLQDEPAERYGPDEEDWDEMSEKIREIDSKVNQIRDQLITRVEALETTVNGLEEDAQLSSESGYL